MEVRTPQKRTDSVRGVSQGRRPYVSEAADVRVRDRSSVRALIVSLVLIAVLLSVALVGFLILANTPAFTIDSIDAEDTEHLSAENIAKLANVEEGTTLLNVDERQVTENLKLNPWVGSVSYVREFPDRLKIVITERKVDSLVKMSTGSVCWCLGEDNVWIEPINLVVQDGRSADDVALAQAQGMGAVLITDVPTSVSPSAGSAATDEVLMAVRSYREQFSDELASQVVRFSAAGPESISCTLSSGVEVSLGLPTNIALKEEVLLQILERHPNQITYVNVRIPAQPSFRKLGVSTVSQGSGVTVDLESTRPPVGGTTSPDASGAGEAPSDGAQDENGYEESYDEYGYDDSDESYGYDSSSTSGTDEYGNETDYILGDDGLYYSYDQYYGLDG